VVEAQHHRVAEVCVVLVVDVDTLHLPLHADGLVLALEVADAEFLREQGRRPGGVDDDVGVQFLGARVLHAHNLPILHDGVVHARVEAVLRALIAAVGHEVALEVSELQDRTRLVLDEVLVGDSRITSSV